MTDKSINFGHITSESQQLKFLQNFFFFNMSDSHLTISIIQSGASKSATTNRTIVSSGHTVKIHTTTTPSLAGALVRQATTSVATGSFDAVVVFAPRTETRNTLVDRLSADSGLTATGSLGPLPDDGHVVRPCSDATQLRPVLGEIISKLLSQKASVDAVGDTSSVGSAY